MRAAFRVALAALLLGVVLWWADPRELVRLTRDAEPRWLLLGLLCAVAANVASALRWWGLSRWLGATPSASWSVVTYFRGVAINGLLPGAVVGGDLYRTHALARRGLPLLEAGVSVLFDRLSGSWILVVLGCLATAVGLTRSDASVLVALGLPTLAPGAFVGLALAGLALPAAVALAWRLGVAVPHADGATRWHTRLALIAHRPRLLAQYGWQIVGSAIVQLLSTATLACGGAALGVDLPYWVYVAAAVPTFLMASLPVSFGGWGTREAAAVLSFGAFGVPPVQAVAVSMLYGLAALAQALGGLMLLAGRRREPA